MANFTEEELPNKNSFMGEMLFIRSFTLYRLKKLWKYVPYIDENVVGMSDAFEAVPNRELDKGNDLTYGNVFLMILKRPRNYCLWIRWIKVV